LASIETAANRYGKYIEPLISTRIDFYVRVFVRVHVGPAQVKMAVTKKSHVTACAHCKSYLMLPLGFMSPKNAEKGKKKGKYSGKRPEMENEMASKGKREDQNSEIGIREEQNSEIGILEESSLESEKESLYSQNTSATTTTTTHKNTHYHYSYPMLSTFSLSSKCGICDGPLQLAGPMWSAPLHQKEFIRDLLKELDQLVLGTRERMEGFLALLLEASFA